METIPRPDPPLADQQVVLEWFGDADVPALVEICNDPQIARFTFIPSPYELRHALDYVENQERRRRTGEALDLAIRAEDGGALLGSTGLRVFDFDRGSCEIGYWTAPDARGRGVASRAVGLFAAWALDSLPIERVELLTDEENSASRRVAEKAGFSLTRRR
ncbi:MAG: GNAT family N-acetyltransferase, partial [Solirubrobacterales bacterium]